MTSRDAIFSKVREATSLIKDKSGLPEMDLQSLSVSRSALGLDPGDLLGRFQAEFQAVGGTLLQSPGELAAFLAKQGVECGYVDPSLLDELAEGLGQSKIRSELSKEQVDEIQFGITRADQGIAETGTLVLSDRGSSSRLGALAPWIHVAVLSRQAIVADVQSAIASLGDDPSIVLVTGPSKTADIEGILIEGVHGPGIQVCLLVA